MITPKEKAEQLIEKFSQHVQRWDCYWDSPRDEEFIIKDASKCAIICAEQLIEVTNYDDWNRPLTDKDKQFWIKVKQILIDKLK